MTPTPLQLGQAPSELTLNSAGFTPLAFANALRIGSSSLVYVAGLLRLEPRIGVWSTVTTSSRPDTEPSVSELLPEPATPVTTTSTPSGMSTSTSRRLRVQPDRRLVEDVGHVGEGGPEVADHLGALRLPARQRARRAVEREVAQPDLHKRVEGVLQRRQQRRHRGLVEAPYPVGKVADLHRADVGDVLPLDLRRAGLRAEPGAVALGAGRECHRPLHEAADVGLKCIDVLGEHRLLNLRDDALVGEVDPFHLDLRRLPVEQLMELLLGELRDRLVHVEAGAAEDAAVP